LILPKAPHFRESTECYPALSGYFVGFPLTNNLNFINRVFSNKQIDSIMRNSFILISILWLAACKQADRETALNSVDEELTAHIKEDLARFARLGLPK